MSFRVKMDNVTKLFGDFVAVDNVDFEIKKGELFTLLGPSGCGKTTLLRMIAGFNPIDKGTISFDEDVINHIPANKRNIGMVFQNYAIFPHLSVYDNVAYGLKARKLDKDEIDKRTMEALELVRISNLKDRNPQQLSGGQQQRVALARAIVIRPSVLLMDEPLSNLDAKLRIEMRTVISKLQKQLGITTVYVTHDQEEALAIADRIGIMNKGVIQQIDSPTEIYKRPSNTFVANFIGTNNFLDGEITTEGDKHYLEIGTVRRERKLENPYSGKVKLSLRPEEVYLKELGSDRIPGTITLAVFLGDYISYEVTLENGQTIEVNEYVKESYAVHSVGDKVGLDFHTDLVNIFDWDKEERLQ